MYRQKHFESLLQVKFNIVIKQILGQRRAFGKVLVNYITKSAYTASTQCIRGPC